MSLRRIKWVMIVAAVGLFAMQLVDYVNFSVDDTFISMRVAKNVTDGHGFVYNIGENVEGYSNWLWVVFITTPLELGFFKGEGAIGLLWFAKGLSILFSIGTLIVTYRFIMRILVEDEHKEIYGLLGVLGVISSAMYSAWSMSGMETTSYSFFLISSISLITSLCLSKGSGTVKPILLGIVLIALVLSRPEGIYMAAIVLGVGAFFNRNKDRRGALLVISGMVVLWYSSFLIWRWDTYGELVPNTYYAKTGGGLRSYLFGIKYAFAGFGSVNALILLFAPFALLKFTEHRMIIALLTSTMIALVFFMVYSGGDWMPGFRFIVPAVPLLAVLAVMSLRMITKCFLSGVVINTSIISATCVVAVLGSIFSGRSLIRAQAPSLGSAFYTSVGHLLPSHTLVSHWLKTHSDTTTIFACGEAGLIGYENQHLRMIDLNGLMDKHIALQRKENIPFDVGYVLNQKPKFIILHGTKEEERERMNYARSTDYYGELGESPRLHNEYRLAFECRSFDVYERK